MYFLLRETFFFPRAGEVERRGAEPEKKGVYWNLKHIVPQRRKKKIEQMIALIVNPRG